jgi:GNAT superfamily N-acetyltransferase
VPTVISVERVAMGDEARASSILLEAATWLIDSGRPQWPVEGLEETVAAAAAAGEAFVASVGGDDVASWFVNAHDAFWWPELGRDHDSRFFHKFAVRRSFAGTGVAKAVLEWSIAHTRSEGCRWLRLDCLDRATLRRLYESVGFEFVDHVAPDGLPERACRYRLDVTAR